MPQYFYVGAKDHVNDFARSVKAVRPGWIHIPAKCFSTIPDAFAGLTDEDVIVVDLVHPIAAGVNDPVSSSSLLPDSFHAYFDGIKGLLNTYPKHFVSFIVYFYFWG